MSQERRETEDQDQRHQRWNCNDPGEYPSEIYDVEWKFSSELRLAGTDFNHTHAVGERLQQNGEASRFAKRADSQFRGERSQFRVRKERFPAVILELQSRDSGSHTLTPCVKDNRLAVQFQCGSLSIDLPHDLPFGLFVQRDTIRLRLLLNDTEVSGMVKSLTDSHEDVEIVSSRYNLQIKTS